MSGTPRPRALLRLRGFVVTWSRPFVEAFLQSLSYPLSFSAENGFRYMEDHDDAPVLRPGAWRSRQQMQPASARPPPTIR
jgi:hypothetical protein